MGKWNLEDVVEIVNLLDDHAKDFNPKVHYRAVKDMEPLTQKGYVMEVGRIATVIMDMQENGATKSELTRAVKYMKVLIQSCDKPLNHRKARTDFEIAKLARKYGHRYWVN